MSERLIVFNPASRRGRYACRQVQKIISSRGEELSRRLQWIPLSELSALEAVSAERVIAIGGDGTINAAAAWLLGTGGQAPLAIIPAGTGNNLARGLGIPLELQRAIELALGGRHLRPLDAARFETGPDRRSALMVQTSALGFPAEIAARYDRLRRHPLLRWLFAPAGPYVYRLLALSRLKAEKRKEERGESLLRLKATLPGEELEETVLAVFVGNERSTGGNFLPCPKAEVDDGKLDLCLIRAGTGESYLRLFRKVVRGEHLALERAVVYRQSAGPLELRFTAPVPILIDGDVRLQSDAYRLEVLPARFRVVVP
ncbi:MAG: hypothetical protein HY717_02040 [Planctomycetes bacterium]|nr:hypothetical protein [Planctomycetota bacterium]